MALLKNFLQTTSVNFPTSWDAFSRSGDDQSRAPPQPPAAASVFGPENQPDDTTSEDASGSLEDDFILRRMQDDAAARWQQAQRNASAPARRNRAKISESHSRTSSRSPALPTTHRTSKSPMSSRLRESKSMDMDSTHSTGPDSGISGVSNHQPPVRRTRTAGSASPKRGCLDRTSSHTSRASTNKRPMPSRAASHTSRGSRSPNGRDHTMNLDAPSSHRKHPPREASRGRNPSLDAHVGQRSNSVRRTQSSVASRLTHSTTGSGNKTRSSTSGSLKKGTIRKSKSMDDTSIPNASKSRMKVTRTDSSSSVKSNHKWTGAPDPLKGRTRPSVAQREFSMTLFKAAASVDEDKISGQKKEVGPRAATSPKDEPTGEEGDSNLKRTSGSAKSKHRPSTANSDESTEEDGDSNPKRISGSGGTDEAPEQDGNTSPKRVSGSSSTKSKPLPSAANIDEPTEEDGESNPKRVSGSKKMKHMPTSITDISKDEPAGEGNAVKRRSRSSNLKRRPTATTPADDHEEQPADEVTRARSVSRSAKQKQKETRASPAEDNARDSLKIPSSEEQEEAGERRRSESAKPKHRPSSAKRSSSKPKERVSATKTRSSRNSHRQELNDAENKKDSRLRVKRCTSETSTGKRSLKRNSSATSRKSANTTDDCILQWKKVVAEQEEASRSTGMPPLLRSATTGNTAPTPARPSFFASLKQALDDSGEEEATVATFTTCSSRKSKMSCHSLPVPSHREAAVARSSSFKLRRQSTNPTRATPKDHLMKDKAKHPVRRTHSEVHDKRIGCRRTLSSDSVDGGSCIEGEERKHHQRKKISIHRTGSHSSGRTPSRSPNRSISRQSSSRKPSLLERSQSPKRISSFGKEPKEVEPGVANQEVGANQPRDLDSNMNETASHAA